MTAGTPLSAAHLLDDLAKTQRHKYTFFWAAIGLAATDPRVEHPAQ